MSKALVNGSSFKPIWTSYNARFTEFELWFRFIFLIMAFGSAVALFQSLRKYSIEVCKLCSIKYILHNYQVNTITLKFANQTQNQSQF